MTYRDSGDFSSITSTYCKNTYQSLYEEEQTKVSKLEREWHFLKIQNNTLQDRLNLLDGQKTSLQDKLKQYEPFEDNVNKLKEKRQKIALIEKKLKKITPELQTLIANQNYSKAMELAQQHQRGLAKLADLMEEKRVVYEQPNAKVPDDFYLKLVEIYQQLPPENSKTYEQRCHFAIKLLEAEKENNIGNAELVKELEIQKLAFYIKISLNCTHSDVSINKPSLIQLLINPEKSGIQQSDRGFEEAVASLAVDRGELQKRVTITQQPMENLAKELDKVDEPKKITFLVQQMEELLIEKKLLEEQKNNLEAGFAARGQTIDVLNVEIAQQKQKEEQQQQTLASKEQEIKNLEGENSRFQKDKKLLGEKLNTTKSELDATKNKVLELQNQIKELAKENKGLKKDKENLQIIVKVKEEEIQGLKADKYHKSLALIQAIEDEIFEYKWEVSFFGGKRVSNQDDKIVTGTAKKILDVILDFYSAIKATKDVNIIQEVNDVDNIQAVKDVDNKQQLADQCLYKIRGIADKGRQRSGLYRFLFQQYDSSVEKYNGFVEKIAAQTATN